MYDVIDVSNYVINYSIDIGKPVSNLKLQKLLYYIQALSIVKNEQIFNDSIMVWRHGPVIKKSYDNFKSFIDSEITDKILSRKTTFVKNGELLLSSEPRDPCKLPATLKG